MSDPAAEAAQRAWVERYGELMADRYHDKADDVDDVAAFVNAAAREALKPIRARHYPVELAHTISGQHKTVCAHCHRRGFFTLESEHGDWPCPDAKDAYATEELA